MVTHHRIAFRSVAVLCAAAAVLAGACASASAGSGASAAVWKPPVGMEFVGSGGALSAAQTQAESRMHTWESANHALCVKRSSTTGLTAAGWNYAIQAECFFN
ncbi:hypothetical protein [Streptomyces sp. NPDC058701]|uniref:hypothetical protein n=1 Tax=Streptomyces sp. NPDC058701 TaxID=3346608 RepID=UPI003664894C